MSSNFLIILFFYDLDNLVLPKRFGNSTFCEVAFFCLLLGSLDGVMLMQVKNCKILKFSSFFAICN